MTDVKIISKAEAKAAVTGLGLDAFLAANRVSRELNGAVMHTNNFEMGEA